MVAGMEDSRTLELARRTLELVQTLCCELEAKHLPEPGFDAENYVSLNEVASTAHIREEIIQATTELQDLVRGPDGIIRHNLGGVSTTASPELLAICQSS